MLRDPLIFLTFPLMVISVFLLSTVSKPDLPHFSLPKIPTVHYTTDRTAPSVPAFVN